MTNEIDSTNLESVGKKRISSQHPGAKWIKKRPRKYVRKRILSKS